MKLLLDTSGYVGFKMGIPELVDFLIEAQAIFLSPIVLGELMFGFRLGTRFQKNMDELKQFIKSRGGGGDPAGGNHRRPLFPNRRTAQTPGHAHPVE